jgi:F-type H+-transporting ATPase subunit delta
MSEKSSIARPYAQAIFDLGVAEDTLGKWSDMFELLIAITQQEDISDLIASRRLDRHKLANLLVDIGKEHLSEAGCNLVKLLADNHKIALLPEIQQAFLRLKAEHEGYIQVDLISTYAVKAPQKQQVTDALKARLGKEVELNVSVDRNLLGGWLIRIGDQVLDLSVRGRFEQLAAELRH